MTRLTVEEFQKAIKREKKERWERLFDRQLQALNMPPCAAEYRFHKTRRWRFDRAWPDYQFAVEIDGLTRRGGRHQTIKGINDDCEKYAEAMLLGWRVLRVTQTMVKTGKAAQYAHSILSRMFSWE